MRASGPVYEMRHIVTLRDTNLLGNVYYVNHVAWQGECREQFLRERAPDVLPLLSKGLVLATLRCSCEFFDDLNAFDEVAVRMRLTDLAATRLSLAFDYVRLRGSGEQLVARGEQQIACLWGHGAERQSCPFPGSLVVALAPFGTSLPPSGGPT